MDARLCRLTRSLAERDGKGAKRPGLARMICSYEYRFDEVRRFAWTVFRKPSDRGFLTRSDGGPRRAGRWRVLDRAGDFSPHLPRPPIPRRLGFVLCCKEPAQVSREGGHRRPTDKRFPLDHP
jgi:hypothetical protein